MAELPDSVRRRIRDLCALRDRAGSEGEATAAARALARVLFRFQVSEAEARAACDPEAPDLDGRPLFEWKRRLHRDRWRLRLADAVCRPFGCMSYVTSRPGRAAGRISLAGLPSDVECARHVYFFCVAAATQMLPKRARVAEKAIWLDGFVDGIRSQLAAELADAPLVVNGEASTALVVVTESKVEAAEAALARVAGGDAIDPFEKVKAGEIDPRQAIKLAAEGYRTGTQLHIGPSLETDK